MDPCIIANVRVKLQRTAYGRGIAFKHLFHVVDLDGNGVLDLDEFIKCVRNVLKIDEIDVRVRAHTHTHTQRGGGIRARDTLDAVCNVRVCAKCAKNGIHRFRCKD